MNLIEIASEKKLNNNEIERYRTEWHICYLNSITAEPIYIVDF